MGRLSLGHAVMLIAVTSYGCGALQPQLADGPCRDPTTGRYITCGSGSGDGSGALIALGVVAGIGVIAGVGYLISRASSPPTPTFTSPTESPVSSAPSIQTNRCEFPVASVRVCVSSLGYRFALPWPSECPTGSTPDGAVQLTCEALDHPAYHACIRSDRQWEPVYSWISCASRGETDAPGDFLPPGRIPAQGIAPSLLDRELAR